MISEDFSFNVLSNRTGEDDFFEVTSFGNEGFWRVTMCDANDVLFDDGAGIEFGSDVVTCRTDNFDAAGEGLMIRFCADEGRQERMVDVDNIVRIFRNHIIADNLHIAGEDDERDAFAA